MRQTALLLLLLSLLILSFLRCCCCKYFIIACFRLGTKMGKTVCACTRTDTHTHTDTGRQSLTHTFTYLKFFCRHIHFEIMYLACCFTRRRRRRRRRSVAHRAPKHAGLSLSCPSLTLAGVAWVPLSI